MQVNHSNNTSEGRSKRLSRDDKELILVGVLVVAVAIPSFLVFYLKQEVSFDMFFGMILEPSSLWLVIAGLIALFVREIKLIKKKIIQICSGKSGAEDENGDVTSPDAPISAVLENARAGVKDRESILGGKLSCAPSSDALTSARDCLRDNDFESAKNLYEKLLSSPESNSEAEIALRLISLYFASDNKNLEKMADEAEELLKSLSSNDALHAEFIRAFAPWVSKCVIPPGNNSLVFREEGTETQKRLSTFFRDTIIALIFSERMSSLSEEEQSALRQSAVTLDRFSGRFFHASRCGYVTVSRSALTENELRMKEIYASLGIEDNRPVFKDEAAEKRAKVRICIGCIIYVALILLLIFAMLALHFHW